MDSLLPIITYSPYRTFDRIEGTHRSCKLSGPVSERSGTQLARTFSIENSFRNQKSLWLLKMEVVGPTELESVTSTVSR